MATAGRPKGQPKSGGRKTGTPNKVSKAAREVVSEMIEQEATHFATAMREIYENDKPLFAALYIKMLPYVTPKLNSVDFRDKTDVDRTFEQQLADMAAENQD